MLRRGVLQAVRGAGQAAAITPAGPSKRALHGSTPAMAKILCSDSIDPVRTGPAWLRSVGTGGWDEGAPARPVAASVAPANNTWRIAVASVPSCRHSFRRRGGSNWMGPDQINPSATTDHPPNPPTLGWTVPVHRTPQVCIQIFKERGHEVDYKVGLPKEELLKIIPEYDGASPQTCSLDRA